MCAISCTTFAGATQASIEYSPVALMRSWSFRLEAVVPCALPPRRSMPQPPTQVHGARQRQVERGLDARGVEGDRAGAGLEFAERDGRIVEPAPAARDGAVIERQRLGDHEVGSTSVSGTPSAKSWIAASMALAAAAQSVQQLWNSSAQANDEA